jgi:hypothetical protein
VRFLKLLGKIVLVIAALVGLLFAAARLHDGPLALIPGGPLSAGNLVATPVTDWSFADPLETIEMQLIGDDTSRTTWILVTEGRAFIPCSLGFPPGKSWHLRADVDGRALLRIEGKRYPVTLRRSHDAALAQELKDIVSSKYGGGPPSDAGVWFFAIESREP